MDSDNIKVSIIGLGYVGLPLLRLFSKHYECVGLDISQQVIQKLQENKPRQGDTLDIEITSTTPLYTSNYSDIADCDIHIVTVPTPIDKDRHPDLRMLTSVCIELSPFMKKGCLVVFESTVAPGTTDEVCVPLLEKGSGLKINEDFYVGYSPERINVGDSIHTTANTEKIIAGSSEYALDLVFRLYSSVIEAPLIKATAIKVAEAAKMYENVQRDVLIALSNEYSKYCRAEGIDINEVTACASTKWNFARAYPGLVGGHCIGVDPYYVIDRAEGKGITLRLINSARGINEQTVSNMADLFIEHVSHDIGEIKSKSLLVLGFSYKRNVGDVRNTKVARFIDIVSHRFGLVDCFDPLVDENEVEKEYDMQVLTSMQKLKHHYDVCIKMLDHTCFAKFEHSIDHYYSLEQFL